MSLVTNLTKKIPRSINPKAQDAIQKIVEYIESIEGLRNNDEGVRKPSVKEVKQLIANGSINPAAGSNGGAGGGGNSIIPMEPSGVTISQENGSVILKWNWPTYSGHGRTEIFRGVTNDVALAVSIGTSAGDSFIDRGVTSGNTYFYFLRHVVNSALGSNSSPLTNGLSITVLAKPKTLFSAITAAISSLSVYTHAINLADSQSSLVTIRLDGAFYSRVLLSAAPPTLAAETGNAIAFEIKRGETVIATVTPVKIQTSIPDANGQVAYTHILAAEIIDTPPASNTTYTITPSRVFSANADYFSARVSIAAYKA